MMKSRGKTNFDERAARWDENPVRVKLAHEVAEAIIREIKPGSDMDALDYGCGTGLVTLKLQPFVKSIIGADSSAGMLQILDQKVKGQGLQNVRTQLADLEQNDKLEGKFHLVVCCMALHHVFEPAVLFKPWYDLLLPGGYLGVADLDTEDGSFHDDNTGVRHYGFDRAHLKKLLEMSGFREIRDITATTVLKNIPDQGDRKFPIFLIVGKK